MAEIPITTATLAQKFRRCAEALEADRARKVPQFALLDVKWFLLAALNDTDRALQYGKPGKGLDDMLGGKNG